MGSDGVRERAAGGSRSATVAWFWGVSMRRVGAWEGMDAYPAVSGGPFGDEGLGGLGWLRHYVCHFWCWMTVL